ncbi:hypothetical protein PF002_g24010 [Phytophthora fragariae]|uniref:Uncharacterized protein n=1 Tax=Phytophthora fragariae TaxID=53985 RepID=A0A6A3X657_9STRA|nr:hypothetical protein PF002_g24010 [Phytophthora fragariae]
MRTTLTTAGRFVSVIIWLCKLHFLSRWELRLSFEKLPGPQQLVFVFVMPLIKHFTKQIIATAAANLHEYVAQVMVFSLAFAFEKQAWALQGHLFVWTIVILHLRLEHYGV